MVSKKAMQLEFINTNDQPANVLTKAILVEKYFSSLFPTVRTKQR
jgi:hypothetical protein